MSTILLDWAGNDRQCCTLDPSRFENCKSHTLRTKFYTVTDRKERQSPLIRSVN